MQQFRGISRNSFEFMKELAANNNQLWFEANRSRWDSLREELRAVCLEMATFVHGLDPELETEPKTGRCLGRINRDTRFTRDKAPYKDYIDIIFFPRKHRRTEVPGLAFGLSGEERSYIGTWLGASMTDWRERLEANIAAHPQIFERYLKKNGNFSDMWIHSESFRKTRVEGLPPYCHTWAQRKFFYMGRLVPGEEVAAAGPNVLKIIEETFLRLYPLFLFATSHEPAADLEQFRRKFRKTAG